ncbi:serine hydrolase domain-containing protein [Paraburkholderia sp. J67]|uniref:serine hydrolase domain-containing protein n=1 Tax=Paraburkholderia sp. J67 TaxID=2805435 RepID=UPI002ABE18D2|nr:serine hydrolase domain-containing protein [Paraburkholderia sp. J67]
MLDANPFPTGAFEGRLGTVLVRFNLSVGPDDRLAVTIDSPHQGAYAIPCDSVSIRDATLAFTVPSIQASWSGTFLEGDRTLSGIWTQTTASSLVLTRDTFEPAMLPPPVDGIWLGTLSLEDERLRIQLVIRTDANGVTRVRLDSVDQHAAELEGAMASLDSDRFSFEVPSIRGRWEGQLQNDAQTLQGTWRQLKTRPLNFKRQAALIPIEPRPMPRMLPARPPVPIDDLDALLKVDMAESLAKGWLCESRQGALAIGVMRAGKRVVLTYGAATPESLFEIGSVTKPFTGLLLAQLSLQGRVALDESVDTFLGRQSAMKEGEVPISLLDLSTHHSGLPRLPENMTPADPANPYADYDEPKLLEYLSSIRLVRAAQTEFEYSNLGVGLLGYLLSKRAGMAFLDLLSQQILEPLDMRETFIDAPASSQEHCIQGRNRKGKAVPAWDLGVLAGAGGIRSTASDMLTFLAAFLDPERVSPRGGLPGETLGAALVEAQLARADAPGSSICLGWSRYGDPETYGHSGATDGFSSHCSFSHDDETAIIVLTNSGPNGTASMAANMHAYVLARLRGKDAPLPPDCSLGA